ncbi:MAG: flagellar biosynthetic protein FliO [Desulfobacterota bacterium]|nr:flagellar biosynthetic protein FliO [Thermodesulfobacteriota bacterium]
MTWAIVKMMLVLGGMLVFLFLLSGFLKRGRARFAGSVPHPEVRILATQCLAPQKYLSLVEIGGEVLALGISDAAITLLTKIENREWIDRLVIPEEKKPPGPLSHPSLPPLFQKPGERRSRWTRWIYGT